MNKLLQSAILLALASAVFFGLSFIQKDAGTSKPDLEAYARQVKQHLDLQTSDFEQLAADEEKISSLLNEKLSSPLFEEILAKPYIFLIYKDDEPVFWNKNIAIPPSFLVKAIKDEVNFLKLPNGFYVITKKTRPADHVTFSIVGLIPVKSDFFVQNNYLKNNFNPTFCLPDCIDLGVSRQEGDAPVSTKEGKPLFYLTLNKAVFNTIPDYRFIGYSTAALLLFFISIHLFAVNIKNRVNEWTALAFLILIAGLTRWVMLTLSFPFELFDINLFNPLLYASSLLNKSLGDLLINILLVFWITVFFFRYIRPVKVEIKNGLLQYVLAVTLFITIFAYAGVIEFLLKSLLLDSKIPFDFNDFLSLNFYSLIGLACISITFMGFFLLTWRLLRWIAALCPLENARLYSLLIALVFFAAFLFLRDTLTEKLLSLGLTFALILFAQNAIQKKENFYSLSNLAIILVIFSLFSSFHLYRYNQIKDFETKKALARKLSVERDLITEYLFIDVQEGILNDLFIRNYFRKPFLSTSEITDRINSKYFSGFFSKYRVNVYTLDSEGKLVNSEDDEYLEILNNDLLENAQQTISDYLFFIPKPSGSYAYISNLPILYRNKLIGSIVLELDPKTYSPTNLYPELLLEEKVKPPEILEKYSYALYSNNFLIKNGGSYPYKYKYNFGDSLSSEYALIAEGNLEHLVYNAEPRKKAVITEPVDTLLQPVSLFSYLFCIFLLFSFSVILVRLIYNIIVERMFIREGLTLSFRDKIQFSMISMIVFSFLAIGFATISHITSEYKTNQEDRLVMKQKAILSALEYSINDNDSIANQGISRVDLVSLSDIHEMDINIYGMKGNIINTSQPEIFEKGLFSNMIDPAALRNLTVNKMARYIHEEKVGELKFLSIYSPVRNNEGELVAYLNLPYFAKEKQLNKEISSFLVALINVYVLLLVFGGFLAYLLSDSITKSFAAISEKLKLVKLGKNEPIEWHSKDEIGNLVQEYNKMIGELERSAKLLAKSERESAWREMAKQIAHEIKNPLTPMKLSIQHLHRAMKMGDPNVKELVEKMSYTLIEQIDNLSHIASEFSSFAKMPKAQNEAVSITDVIQSVVDLFNENEYVSISFEKSGREMKVFADKNQLLSAFNNLVKNASQAIPHGRQGEIKINVFTENGSIIAAIKDNGTGISREQEDKVFVPNFTTKSGGTGLGLALTKEIIENAKGKIWFESQVNIGTTFFVKLPEYKNNYNEIH